MVLLDLFGYSQVRQLIDSSKVCSASFSGVKQLLENKSEILHSRSMYPLIGEYMIVVTDRIKVGRMGEHDIFKLKDYKIMPFSRNYLALSEVQVTNNRSTECEPTDQFHQHGTTMGN